MLSLLMILVRQKRYKKPVFDGQSLQLGLLVKTIAPEIIQETTMEQATISESRKMSAAMLPSRLYPRVVMNVKFAHDPCHRFD